MLTTGNSIGKTRVAGVALLLLGLLASQSALAADVYICESRDAANPPETAYTDVGFANSTGNVTAPGCNASGSRYSGTGTYFGPSRFARFRYTNPTAESQDIKLELAWTSTAGQISTAIHVYTGADTGNTTADIWGNTGGPMDVIFFTTMDMNYKGTAVWNQVVNDENDGYFTVGAGASINVSIYGGYKTPYAGGVTPADTISNRVAAGAARFTVKDPCLNTPSVQRVDGPLEVGSTTVNIVGVSTSATEVKLYKQDAVPTNPPIYIASNNAPGGQANVTVTWTAGEGALAALAATDVVLATQVVNGQEGCTATAPTAPVGAGNSGVTLSMVVRDGGGGTGPIGTDGSGSGYLKIIGPTSFNASTPQGKPLATSSCWQTITFCPTMNGGASMDPTYNVWPGISSSGTMAPIENGGWGVLEELVISMDPAGLNSGPYTLYIDEITNGGTKVTGFESSGEIHDLVVGAEQPFFLNPASIMYVMPNPSVSLVTDEQAYAGTQSTKIQFQFLAETDMCYVRLYAYGETTYKRPQIRLDAPTSFRILLLAPGATASNKPTITAQPQDVAGVCPTGPASFTIAATVPGADGIGYQWQQSTDYGYTFTDISGETATTHSFTTAADEDAIRYRCIVTDTTSGCFAVSTLVRVLQTPQVTTHPIAAHACSTDTVTFSAAGSAPAGFTLNYQWKENGVNMSNTGGVSGATTATLTVPAAGRNGNLYSCEISTACATPKSVTSDAAILTVQGTPTLVASTSGSVTLGTVVTLDVGAFAGQYYNTGSNGVNSVVPQGTPVLGRIDPVVDFDWGDNAVAPGPGVNMDNITVRWQTVVRPPVADGTYTFYTRTDDGSRLWVDGALILDDWSPHGARETASTPVVLAAGTHTVKMEYFEGAVAASAKLYWSGPGLNGKTDLPYVLWKKNGEATSNTGGRYNIASFSAANAGRYTAETVDPCTGSTLSFGPVDLFVSADFDNSGKVDAVDVANFILCATNPDVPYVPPLTSPCVETMDQDGDGDIDTDDFGSVQAQFAP